MDNQTQLAAKYLLELDPGVRSMLFSIAGLNGHEDPHPAKAAVDALTSSEASRNAVLVAMLQMDLPKRRGRPKKSRSKAAEA